MSNESHETRAIRIIARIAPWLAPVPSGYFVARSSYNHLLAADAPWLAIPVAVVIGVMIEMLGVASVHTLQDLNRWNRQPNVRRQGGWERAPTGAAWLAVIAYFGATFALLLVLETIPTVASIAPFLFPIIAIAGATVWSVRNQQDERRERYGVDETLRRVTVERRSEREATKPVTEPNERLTDVTAFPFVCEECGERYATQNALAGHMNAHRRNGRVKEHELEVIRR